MSQILKSIKVPVALHRQLKVESAKSGWSIPFLLESKLKELKRLRRQQKKGGADE